MHYKVRNNIKNDGAPQLAGRLGDRAAVVVREEWNLS